MDLYLAPLQGYTDCVFRKSYEKLFGNINKYFVPYISIGKGGVIRKSQEKDVYSSLNKGLELIPQVLCKDTSEFLYLVKYLEGLGYKEVNLNLGCPYPMATKKGRGSGLLPLPAKVKEMLDIFPWGKGMELSVKMRLGLVSENEAEALIPIMNDYPLTEVIIHPRIAKDMYKGQIRLEKLLTLTPLIKHRLIYNGDIVNKDLALNYLENYGFDGLMLGRGILSNLFLVDEIKGKEIDKESKRRKLEEFHKEVYLTYFQIYDDNGVLQKMKVFWDYFSMHFPDPRLKKKIGKVTKVEQYHNLIGSVFAYK